MPRRAKIGGTLGPACDDPGTLRRLLRGGLDLARLNFSHGTADEHARRAEELRRAAREAGRAVALLADLQGPRLRVGSLPGGSIDLRRGGGVDLVAGRSRAADGALPVAHAALARDVRRGDRVLIDDGKVELRVERVRGPVVRCAVVRGGRVTDRKGINLPGVQLSVPTITAKDRRDLATALALRVDWLAVSFVRCAEDVRQARRLLRRAGADLPVMAKIERREAIDRLDEILREADALLVARGDMGVEMPPEDVPILQKRIIDAAHAAGKPVVTATQMLDSMRHSQRPTRAEASDVANAVLDGSSCLLLTAETAVGEYPVEAVQTMARIIERAEESGRGFAPAEPRGGLSVAEATAQAACRAAAAVGARFLVAFTTSGFTAGQVARFRPAAPILACTPHEEVARRLAPVWGVRALVIERTEALEDLVRRVDHELLERKLARPDDLVVLLGGAPVGVPGTTNLMKIHRLGLGGTRENARRARSPGTTRGARSLGSTRTNASRPG
jgi:pyruvate kinase